MNWYRKIAALESAWWARFYEHLSRNAEFIFAESGMQLTNNDVTGTRFSSGIDGSKIFFGFSVLYKNNKYSCGVNLEFSDTLINSQMKWQNASLMSLETDGSIELHKASWYAIRNMRQEGDVVGRGFFLAKNAQPNPIMIAIKDSILNDDDSDNDDQMQSPEAPPSNSMKLELPVPAKNKQFQSLSA